MRRRYFTGSSSDKTIPISVKNRMRAYICHIKKGPRKHCELSDNTEDRYRKIRAPRQRNGLLIRHPPTESKYNLIILNEITIDARAQGWRPLRSDGGFDKRKKKKSFGSWQSLNADEPERRKFENPSQNDKSAFGERIQMRANCIVKMLTF